MATLTSERSAEPWKRRILLPNYQIGEAAKYAQISPQTVAAWHRDAEDQRTLSFKESRAALSYMQLIEVAVVAAFRRANVSLKDIRKAREYAKNVLKAEFPFSQYKFKTDGKDLLMDFKQIVGARKGKDKLLVANKHGQLAWSQIIGTLKEFDYEGGLAIRWHVAGGDSPVIIDPRISFGAPTVSGIPTWVISGRRDAGESLDDIAEDFGLKVSEVKKALAFESEGQKREKEWVN